YKAFLNGVADAVDTGTLSSRGRQALDQTRESLLALQSWDRSFQAEPFLDLVDTLRNAARSNPAVKELLPLRPVANRVNVLLTGLADSYDLREHANIEDFALSVKRQVWIVLVATAITLASAAGFVVLLIKGLTEPLNRAVTLAESIAAGD